MEPRAASRQIVPLGPGPETCPINTEALLCLLERAIPHRPFQAALYIGHMLGIKAIQHVGVTGICVAESVNS
ncbi:hypothetical protein D3C77_568050 [compost metagenome]